MSVSSETLGSDSISDYSMDPWTTRATAAHEAHMDYLKWRLGGMSLTSKTVETATNEFWTFWDRALTKCRPVPDGPTSPPKFKIAQFPSVTRVAPGSPKKTPKAKVAPAKEAPVPIRKRLIRPDLGKPKPKRSRVALFIDDEAEEVAHRVAQQEDDDNESEDPGSLRDFVAPDGEQDGQGTDASSPLL